MKKSPKILLASPTYEGKAYCIDFWVSIIKEIKKERKCDILIVDNSKSSKYSNILKKRYKLKVIKSPNFKKKPLTSLAKSREKIYKYAIKNNYDFLFSVEQDIFPPKDIINQLLKIRKSIKQDEAVIGTPYIITKITYGESPYLDKDMLTNVALKREYSKKLKRKIQINLTRKQMKKRKKIFKAYAAGFGCTLIDVSILKKIKVKVTEKRYRPDDAFFFLDCQHMNIPTYVDPNLMDKIIHIPGNAHGIDSWGKFVKRD